MSVEAILAKVNRHSTDVLGSAVMHDGKVYAQIPEIYQLADMEKVFEYAESMFNVMESMGEGAPQFDHMILQYENHRVYLRRISGGMLFVLNVNEARVTFKKLQIAVNLFVKALERELENPTAPKGLASHAHAAAEAAAIDVTPETEAPEAAAQAEPAAAKAEEKPKGRRYRGVLY